MARATSRSSAGSPPRSSRANPTRRTCGGGFEEPWYYADAEVTAERLRAAGFAEVEAWLQPWDVVPADPREFMRTLILKPHLDSLPPELHEQFLDDVLAGQSASRCTPALRAPQHRGRRRLTRRDVESAPMTDAPRIVVLPGDGIGPEIVAAARELLDSLGEFNLRRAPDGRLLDRRARRRPHRRGAGGLQGRRRGPARRGRRSQMGHDRTPTTRAPSRACSACAKAWASTPTCARCARARR